MSSPVHLALARALDVLEGAADILRERVPDGRPPSWADRRGYSAALEALTDDELTACEELGLPRVIADLPSAPRPLIELAAAVAAATALPLLPNEERDLPPLPGVRERKRRQLAALLAAITPMAAHKRRIVDIGAGKGHFSRAASEAFTKEVLGIDRDPARVRSAADLAADAGSERASFLRLDVMDEALPLAPDDLAVGLHACGEVGDITARAAAESGADIALVSCCLQKIRANAREPLSSAARSRGASFPREILGLSNLTSRPMGVELPLAETNIARERRLALRLLLRARGERVEHGEELRGQNRRRAYKSLSAIAEHALALRGLAPPTDQELQRFEEEGKHLSARARRYSLPRSMLSRLVEVTINLDRAALLEERGHRAAVIELFNPVITARNIVVLASRDPASLPL